MGQLEDAIAQALSEHLEEKIAEAVSDQLCSSEIANELDIDEIVSNLDIDYKFDDAIGKWLGDNFDTIADEYRSTAEHIVSGMAEAQMLAWLLDNRFRFEPLHRRCSRWVTQVCKNSLSWVKKTKEKKNAST